MPLVPPQLDDRQFDELLADAKLRLRRYCPEWTDYNDSDPGIALVQLFAWLTELMLYRINQVPEKNYLTFLKLLNLERHEARPSRTHVVLTMAASSGAPSPQAVRKRARFFVSSESGDALTFESVEPIDLVPYALNSVQVFDGLSYDDYSETNASTSLSLRPLGWTPQHGNAFYLGYDVGATDRVGAPIHNAAFPDEIVLHFFLPDSRPSPIRGGESANDSELPMLVWEYVSKFDRELSETGEIDRDFSADRWRPLTVFEDSTKSLTSEGNIILRGPGADCLATHSPKAVDDKLRFWIRCRLTDGDFPKELVPEISFVRSNVVQVEHMSTHYNEVVGIGDGTQSQFQLENHPVDKDSLQLVVMNDDESGTEACVQKDDLYLSSRDDLDFTLNPNSGEIRFGNGKKGKVPGAGQKLVALSYRAGGGIIGNVPAHAIKDPPLGVSNIDSVTNPRPAMGGIDEETLQSLKERAPRVLRGDARAVTEDDYRRFAEEIPGVGRAIVLSQYLPEHRGLKIPGAVTVIVVPSIPLPDVNGNDGPPRFVPTQGLLEAVVRRLDKCRPAGTELVVTAPRVRQLELDVAVVPASDISEHQVRDQIKKVLEHYFRPVEVASTGPEVDPLTFQRRKPPPLRWDIGTPIYPSRIYEVLLTATDSENGSKLIQSVSGVKLMDQGREIPPGEALPLESDQLPYVLVTVRITANAGRRNA